MNSERPYVTKRNGEHELYNYNAVQERLDQLCKIEPAISVTTEWIATKVFEGLTPGIRTSELDTLACEAAMAMVDVHPDYRVLAGRLLIGNLHPVTPKSWSEFVDICANHFNAHARRPAPLLRKKFVDFTKEHKERLDAAIDPQSDYTMDALSVRTFLKSYAIRSYDGTVLERPSYMYMRAAIETSNFDIDVAIETYRMLVSKLFTFATPTLCNSGFEYNQLASCFVRGTKVITSEGPKNIEDVRIDDRVVSHKGEFKPVTQLHINPINGRTLYELDLYGTPTLKVTDNHRFMAVRRADYRVSRGGRYAFSEPEWISVEDMDDNCYVAIPNAQHNAANVPVIDVVAHATNQGYLIEVDGTKFSTRRMVSQNLYDFQLKTTKPVTKLSRKSDPVPTTIAIDDDVATFMGVWLGDGHLIVKNKKDGSFDIRGVGITVDKSNTRLIDFCSNVIESKFGCHATLHQMSNQNIVQVLCNSVPIGAAFFDMFGRGFANKRLHASLFTWPKHLVESLLVGLISSDGCISAIGGISIQMTNVSLMHEVFCLARQNGIVASYATHVGNYNGTSFNTGTVRLPSRDPIITRCMKVYKDDRLLNAKTTTASCAYHIELNGTRYVRMQKKAISQEKHDYVYTIGVEDHHSYPVEGVLAENCFLYAIAEDSIPSIFDAVKDIALCSKFGGGIGLSIHKVRARGSYIASTNGKSNGITEMLKVFNNVARYVDQCFAPETKVLADGGNWINIKDVVPRQTKLMTTKGVYQLVDDVRSYDNSLVGSSCLRITTSAHPDKSTIVTEAHPFLVLQYKDGSRFTLGDRDTTLPDVLQCEWVEAKHLAVGDLISWFEPGVTEGLVAVGRNLYARVHSIEAGVSHDGYLYDLDMSDSQHTNYLTEIGFAHNGGGKRKGSFSIYLEPWHADFMEFLELKDQKSTLGRNVADDLFYATWVPDLFWKRVSTPNGRWSFFCPDQARGLEDVSGEEFEQLYERYEKEGLARKTMKAVDVLNAIVESQKRTGGPSILSKDQCNFKSNQKHSGPIYSSNLCTEIILLTNENETAVCNLSSISLKAFVNQTKDGIDLPALEKVVRQIVRALNVVIDNQYYAISKAKYSNLRHRPIAIGVQGLQELFFELRLPFESAQAAVINRTVFEALYFYALRESCDLAKKFGHYETFNGSPASQGLLQFHLWGVEPNRELFAWDALIEDIMTFGLRNCQVIGLMPTASTSALMGNTESFEPQQANFFTRGTLAGENTLINSYMAKDLMMLKKWTPEIRNQIIKDRGSVQNLDISSELKELYKHAYEVKVKTVIDLAADRGAFVDHSQSMNLFMYDPTASMVSKALLYGHKKQLKTQLYYLRSKTAGSAQQFAIKQQPRPPVQEQIAPVRDFFTGRPKDFKTTSSIEDTPEEVEFVCTREEGCFSCGS